MSASPGIELTAADLETDSKTARMAAERVRPAPDSRLVQRFADLRKVLRSPSMRPYSSGAATSARSESAKARSANLLAQ